MGTMVVHLTLERLDHMLLYMITGLGHTPTQMDSAPRVICNSAHHLDLLCQPLMANLPISIEERCKKCMKQVRENLNQQSGIQFDNFVEEYRIHSDNFIQDAHKVAPKLQVFFLSSMWYCS